MVEKFPHETLYIVMQCDRLTCYVGWSEIEAQREAIHSAQFMGWAGDGTTAAEWKKMEKNGYRVITFTPNTKEGK